MSSHKLLTSGDPTASAKPAMSGFSDLKLFTCRKSKKIGISTFTTTKPMVNTIKMERPHPLINMRLQKKAQKYSKKKDLFNIIRLSIVGVYLFLFYLSGVSEKLSAFALTLTMPVALIIYTVVLAAPLLIILFPVTYFKDFIMEKRFRLSTRSFKSWFADEVKGLALGFILGYPVILFLFFLFNKLPGLWWVFGVIGLFLFQVCLTVLFPVVILPLFFKQKPVEDEELKNRIASLLKKTGLSIKGIYSFNLSSKTKKENAALTGLWKTRRVLLGDTLLANRTGEEIEVVLAHEIGHHLRKHFFKLSILSLATSFVLFFFIDLLMSQFTGFPNQLSETLTLFPVMILLSGLISFPIQVGSGVCTRALEKNADLTSLTLTGNPDAFIKVMAGLANSNLAVAYPRRIKVILSYSHPPIGSRIDLAQSFK
jgi:STE24 endopeptidase